MKVLEILNLISDLTYVIVAKVGTKPNFIDTYCYECYEKYEDMLDNEVTSFSTYVIDNENAAIVIFCGN